MDFNPVLLSQLLAADLGYQADPLRAFKAETLKKSLLKKYVEPANSGALHQAALQDFLRLNEVVSNFFVQPGFISSTLFRTWKDQIYSGLYSGDLQTPTFSLGACIDEGKCGPGSSLGATDTSFYTKMFDGPLTVTSAHLHTYYTYAISGRWSQSEAIRSKAFPTVVVAGSRLETVPKDSTKNRTICIEPSLNMFYQLGLKNVLESVLRKTYHIDVSTQPDINKALAQHGSIDGSLATIDLKNASDSISLDLCRHLLPPAFYELLMQIRSPKVQVDGVDHELHMVSTMGNGFTFPLMTMMFAALVKSIYILNGVDFVPGKTYGVFGDDIIVTTDMSHILIGALEQVGFTVNTEKSFVAGPFRESCGGDFYLGHDVRGVYIKEFTNEANCYSAFNRLHFWALRHNFNLSGTLQYLKGLVDFQPVPGHCGLHEGFIVTRAQLTSPKLDPNGAIYYRSLSRRPFSVKVGDSVRNPFGALICAIGGYIQGQRMNLRPKAPRFIVKKLKTPCWDFLTFPGVLLRDLDASWSSLLSVD